MFLAKLGLSGRLRPVPGALHAILTATGSEPGTVVIATGNHAEGLAPGTADNLADVVSWLRCGATSGPQAARPGR